MRLSEIVPGRSDRALLVGQTGSGKTVLAECLLQFRRYVVVCDPKRRIQWTGYTIHQTLKSLTQAKGDKLIYRPSHDAIREWDSTDDEVQRFFEWVYRRGNTTLYVDESYMVTRGEELPRFYHAALTQGRELGVETWSATQRPMNVPQVIMSESEHVYAFRLRMPQDRAKVERICGIPDSLLEDIPKHRFYYARQDDEPIGPLMLDLATRRINA